jgi:hypothetical protein
VVVVGVVCCPLLIVAVAVVVPVVVAVVGIESAVGVVLAGVVCHGAPDGRLLHTLVGRRSPSDTAG